MVLFQIWKQYQYTLHGEPLRCVCVCVYTRTSTHTRLFMGVTQTVKPILQNKDGKSIFKHKSLAIQP